MALQKVRDLSTDDRKSFHFRIKKKLSGGSGNKQQHEAQVG
jgi:hypothetical protein